MSDHITDPHASGEGDTSMSEKVRIEIQARQTVNYLQTIEVSPEDAKKLARLYKSSDRKDERELADWVGDLLDKRDVSDADEVEDIELAIVTEDDEIDHDAFDALADLAGEDADDEADDE